MSSYPCAESLRVSVDFTGRAQGCRDSGSGGSGAVRTWPITTTLVEFGHRAPLTGARPSSPLP